MKPVVKKISVILKREPLIELRYEKTKISQNSDSKQNCLLKSKTRRRFKDLDVNEVVQPKKTDANEKNTKDPENIYKILNVSYKECKVVLDKLYPHKFHEAEDISQEKIDAPHKNKLPELNSETCSKHFCEKIPVYKQFTKDNSKQNNDMYEFDELDTFEDTSDAQQHLQKRKRKLKHISRVRKKKQKIDKNATKGNKMCLTYDQTVQEILQRVLRKVNKDKLQVQTSTPIKQKSHFDCDVVSPIQEDPLSHVGDDNIEEYDLPDVEVDENILENKKENSSPNNNTNIFKSLCAPLQDLENSKENNSPNNNTNVIRSLYISLKKNKRRQIQEDISHMSDTNIEEYDLHNVEVDENTLENKKENSSPSNNTNIFNFLDNPLQNLEKSKKNNSPNNNTDVIRSLYIPLQKNKRIQIISDIMLDRNDYFSFFDEDLRPNANSTVLLSAKCYPWRFNENVKRNPHYLSIKKNALPALQQDMVLDYKQLKKLEQHFAKTPIRKENSRNKRNPVEESECIQDIADKENNPRLSLFEDDIVPEVQPKLITDYFLRNKHKRTILGPIIPNTNNIIKTTDLPKGNIVETTVFIEKVLKPTKDINVNFKKSPKNVVDQPKDKNLEPRLFEDDEPNLNFNENSKIYVSKTRKKRKLHYPNDEELHQGKHKSEMSKAEEAELEKWATKFNSLCEDIEKYQLEID